MSDSMLLEPMGFDGKILELVVESNFSLWTILLLCRVILRFFQKLARKVISAQTFATTFPKDPLNYILWLDTAKTGKTCSLTVPEYGAISRAQMSV
jgi:hypothetical protein